MPTENDTKTTKTSTVDVRDAKIASLELKVAELEKKLKEKTAATPSGDYCVLRGKRYEIRGVVEAKEAGDQARKGNMDLTEELVILKR